MSQSKNVVDALVCSICTSCLSDGVMSLGDSLCQHGESEQEHVALIFDVSLLTKPRLLGMFQNISPRALQTVVEHAGQLRSRASGRDLLNVPISRLLELTDKSTCARGGSPRTGFWWHPVDVRN